MIRCKGTLAVRPVEFGSERGARKRARERRLRDVKSKVTWFLAKEDSLARRFFAADGGEVIVHAGCEYAMSPRFENRCVLGSSGRTVMLASTLAQAMRDLRLTAIFPRREVEGRLSEGTITRMAARSLITGTADPRWSAAAGEVNSNSTRCLSQELRCILRHL